jgi:hypothetical protein
MQAVVIAVIVFGPLLAFFVLLFKSIRKLTPRRAFGPPFWKPQEPEQPPGGGDLAGDREPRRPLIPAGSNAVSLALPAVAAEEDQPLLRRAGSQPDRQGADHRLTG